jgi:predicted 3-demethylubiquinone-9 3-methyltransferase (glyoxalase superfamily)
MSKLSVQKIVPHLWYAKEAEEAARFYATVFPKVTRRPRRFVAC